MSEFQQDFPRVAEVFSDEYWGEAQIQPAPDILIGRMPLIRTGEYPELGPKLVNYFAGEAGAVLSPGSPFEPNNPNRQEWYTAPGSLLIYDYEVMVLIDKDNAKPLVKPKDPDEADSLLSLNTRELIMEGTDNQMALYNLPKRHFVVAAEVGDYVHIYKRCAGVGIIESYQNHLALRSFRLSITGKNKGRGESYSPGPGTCVPFEIGMTMDVSQDSMPRSRLQRVNRLEILEAGQREASPDRKRGRRLRIPTLSPRLGRTALNF